jgi:hypothetical protein
MATSAYDVNANINPAYFAYTFEQASTSFIGDREKMICSLCCFVACQQEPSRQSS